MYDYKSEYKIFPNLLGSNTTKIFKDVFITSTDDIRKKFRPPPRLFKINEKCNLKGTQNDGGRYYTAKEYW